VGSVPIAAKPEVAQVAWGDRAAGPQPIAQLGRGTVALFPALAAHNLLFVMFVRIFNSFETFCAKKK
jgi:hypothetical protein